MCTKCVLVVIFASVSQEPALGTQGHAPQKPVRRKYRPESQNLDATPPASAPYPPAPAVTVTATTSSKPAQRYGCISPFYTPLDHSAALSVLLWGHLVWRQFKLYKLHRTSCLSSYDESWDIKYIPQNCPPQYENTTSVLVPLLICCKVV